MTGHAPSRSSTEPVFIARCPEHGLHGERTHCYECGVEVEQVAMVPAAERDQLREAVRQMGAALDEAAETGEDPERTVERLTDLVLKAQPLDAGAGGIGDTRKLVMLAEEILRLDARDPVDEGPDGYQEADNVDAWPDAPAVGIATQVIAQRRHDA